MRRALGWTLLLLPACARFGPVPPAVTELLATRPPPPPLRRGTARARIDGRGLAGGFTAVVALSRSAGRLQLLPEFGPKVLDVTATPDRVRGRSVDAPWADAPRGLDAFLGFTLLEHAAPLTPARVRGARALDGGGWELDVAPAAGAGSVRVRLDAAGRVVARRYEFRRARWRERFAPEHTIAARGFALRFTRAEERAGDRVPDGLFAPAERP